MTDPIDTIDAKLAHGAGTTTREVVVRILHGHALMGPAWFPIRTPKLSKGEQLAWTRNGWVIEPAKPL